jgi:methionine sulfoxide reductase heme-binding subunit
MLTAAAVSSSPRVLWYLTRGTGIVALILLSITVALGVANRKRLQTDRVPRFVIDLVHRNASLLAVSFVLIHVVTTLLDSYVSISVVNVIVPFTASYKPLWLGLGAVAFDLLMAVALTSILRRRLGHRAWRATHWLAYVSWPVALVHALGTGTDRGAHWMLAITGACILTVGAALITRLTVGEAKFPSDGRGQKPLRTPTRASKPRTLTPATKPR